MRIAARPWAWPALFLPWLLAPALLRADLPKAPQGFEVRLIASVPAVVYPCQLAAAPDGSLFIAEDPMDQVGPYEAAHGRILRFRDGEEPVEFAAGFRAIFGMAWHDGSLYVCHMPFLTVIRDNDGDGKADERKDLFKDLGPTNNQGLNDHIVSGLQFGMDGWLYISVGDKGVPGATGSDGRPVQLMGGGILRCRPDGSGLEVYSSGTRNHLEPNLDERDNLFTYDNTDDGDGWWTRVTHHVDGGYYGYPYDYHDRPDRMLPRMSEYGGGSPCGAIFYKEDVWPEAYRGVAFWAEWGKGKVHAFRFEPQGATFKISAAIDFAVPDSLSNFHPIDLALSYDGRTLYVADWNMGGWGSKTEKVGRVFAITHNGEVKTRPRGNDKDPIPDQLAQLDHPSFNERMRAQRALIQRGQVSLGAVTAALVDPNRNVIARRHLIWALDGIAGGTPEASLPIMDVLKSPEADLRAQAARALGQRRVPLAVDPLLSLLTDAEPTVRLQAVIALGRIGDPHSVAALIPVLADAERWVAFSARQAVRRIGDLRALAAGLDSAESNVRLGVLAALELQYTKDAVTALADYVQDRKRPPEERARALRFLAEVHRKAKPWDGHWWGTRPTQSKPPPKVDVWAGSAVCLDTLRLGLGDSEPPVRRAAVQGMIGVGDRDLLPLLRDRFGQEREPLVRKELARALGQIRDDQAVPLLLASLADGHESDDVRDAALASLAAIGSRSSQALVGLLARDDFPTRLQRGVIAVLGTTRARDALAAVVAKVSSPDEGVRTAAAEAIGELGQAAGAPPLRPLLEDPSAPVRRAAASALGLLKDRESIPALLEAADHESTRFEASLALTATYDARALRIYVRALSDRNQDLRNASARAIGFIRDEAAPILDQLAERRELSPAAVSELRKIYSGIVGIVDWRLLGPFPLDAKPPVSANSPIDFDVAVPALDGRPATWKRVQSEDEHGQVNLGKIYTPDRLFAYAYAELQSAAARRAQLAVGSDDALTVWLNGKQVYDYPDDRGFEPDQARVEVELVPGVNRVLIKCANHGGDWRFGVAVSTPVMHAFLTAAAPGSFDPEAYREHALKGSGKAERGKSLFSDLKGLACIKCHAVAGEGGKVGPDLSAVGAAYQRDELIASVLFPSAKIFSGYETDVVATHDGRVLTGIVKSDTAEALELDDANAQRVVIPKTEIDERKRSAVSLMPSGLAEGLSKEDFADVIAYLESLRQKKEER
jgi:putative membrane-bound dehydrogenase-like protein